MSFQALPLEIVEKIAQCVHVDHGLGSSIHQSSWNPSSYSGSRQDLINLRLASRVASAATIPVLLQYVKVEFRPHRAMDSHEWAKKFHELAKSPHARHVQFLDIEFLRCTACYGGGQQTLCEDLRRLDTEIPVIVPALICACTQLKGISMLMVRQNSTCLATAQECSQRRWMLLSTIVKAMVRCPPSLKALNLYLPVEHDLDTLVSMFSRGPESDESSAMLPACIARLSQLSLTLVGGGDRRGLGSYRRVSEHNNLGSLQRFASLATNLTVLQIDGKSGFRIDARTFIPRRLTTIRKLGLSGIVALATTLIGLLEDNQQLCEIRFHDVQLRSHDSTWPHPVTQLPPDSWEDVLTALLSLDGLVDFFIASCGYCEGDWRGGFASRDDRLGQKLLTFKAADLQALSRAMKHVQDTRLAAGRVPLIFGVPDAKSKPESDHNEQQGDDFEDVEILRNNDSDSVFRLHCRWLRSFFEKCKRRLSRQGRTKQI